MSETEHLISRLNAAYELIDELESRIVALENQLNYCFCDK